MRYLVSGRFFNPTCIMGMMFFRCKDAKRSYRFPFFRNLVVNHAYGPNNNDLLPSITRVSR